MSAVEAARALAGAELAGLGPEFGAILALGRSGASARGRRVALPHPRQLSYNAEKGMMKRRFGLFAGVFLFVIAACVPAAPLPPGSSTPVQPMLTASSTSMSPPATEPQPSETPSSLPTPTISCETHTASVVLATSAESLKVGDTVIVTVTLNNRGCTALGLPQYRLYIQSDRPESVLAPDKPEPTTHYLGVAPEQSDIAEFSLQAVADGQALLTATVSFEVHLGYPGPAYWGSSSAESLLLNVTP